MKTVLITGGASGIGLCLAKEFLEAGYYVHITDIKFASLWAAEPELRKISNSVELWQIDSTDRKLVSQMVNELFTDVDIVINNAGIGYSGEISETTLETWERLISVNLIGPLNYIYAFLPLFIKRGSGQFVNISSGQAFFRLPTWGAYASVKLALGAMSEILHFELKKFGIKVTTVYPFMVNTPFYSGVKAETFGSKLSMKLLPYYSQSPEKVARTIFKAIVSGKRVEMVSPLNYLGKYMQIMPILPNVVSWTVAKFLGKSKEELKKIIGV